MAIDVLQFIPKPGNIPGTPYHGGSFLLSNGQVVTDSQLQAASSFYNVNKGGGFSVSGIDPSKLPGAQPPAPAPAPAPAPTPTPAPPPAAAGGQINQPTYGGERPMAPTPQQQSPILEDGGPRAAAQAAVKSVLDDQVGRAQTILSDFGVQTTDKQIEDDETNPNYKRKKLLGE